MLRWCLRHRVLRVVGDNVHLIEGGVQWVVKISLQQARLGYGAVGTCLSCRSLSVQVNPWQNIGLVVTDELRFILFVARLDGGT